MKAEAEVEQADRDNDDLRIAVPDTSRYAFNASVSMGRVRIRLPVAAKMALHRAGITGGNAGSPRPVGGWSVVRKCTSTGGA